MNKQADILAGLASSLSYPGAEIIVPVCEKWVMPPLFEAQEHEEGEREESMAITITSGVLADWRQPLIDYLQHGRLPKDLQKRIEIRRRAPRFLYFSGTLFRKSFGIILLRCLSNAEATQAMNEAHSVSRISNSYNKKLRQHYYQLGDMMLAVKQPIYTLRKNVKIVPKWDGPYVVQEVYTIGSYLLVDQEGLKVGPINGCYLKKYYP
ncbi:hypothetical protein LIER_24313 [Lithospermum erythrorhizon]|uniref:Uncharacterized protein n=1 Tax=Lithospermum erythrorhizon TaxID=34254 RepID=A0AAV3R3P2_LITER